MNYKVGSLFAGFGCICRGIASAKVGDSGYELIWANDIDEYACETYRTNYNHSLLEGDINLVLEPSNSESKKEEFKAMNDTMFNEEIDILNGGFPCQAFSIVG